MVTSFPHKGVAKGVFMTTLLSASLSANAAIEPSANRAATALSGGSAISAQSGEGQGFEGHLQTVRSQLRHDDTQVAQNMQDAPSEPAHIFNSSESDERVHDDDRQDSLNEDGALELSSQHDEDDEHAEQLDNDRAAQADSFVRERPLLRQAPDLKRAPIREGHLRQAPALREGRELRQAPPLRHYERSARSVSDAADNAMLNQKTNSSSTPPSKVAISFQDGEQQRPALKGRVLEQIQYSRQTAPASLPPYIKPSHQAGKEGIEKDAGSVKSERGIKALFTNRGLNIDASGHVISNRFVVDKQVGPFIEPELSLSAVRLDGALPSLVASASAGSAQSVNVSIHDPNWSQMLSERVAQAVKQSQFAGLRTQTIEMRLDPPNLGPLKVHLQMNEAVNVQFFSPHSAVRQAVEYALHELDDMFRRQGLTLGQADVGDNGSDEFVSHQFDGEKQSGNAGASDLELNERDGIALSSGEHVLDGGGDKPVENTGSMISMYV